MLIHYGNKSYQEAAGEAAAKARAKMINEIKNGKRSAVATIQKVMSEIPDDHIVRADAIEFKEDVDDLNLQMSFGGNTLGVADNALQQICSRADVPIAMYRKLVNNHETEGWGPPLMSHVFNEFYKNMGDEKRFLVRSYNGRARGFLSTSYRRLDSRPLMDSFFQASQELGMVPIRGYASETKVMLKTMLPTVYAPAPNEVVAFGATWENSDYGNGRLAVSAFVLRLYCTNYAITENALSQVHLGKRLSDDILFSQKTYELDTATSASAIRDIVYGSFSENRIQLLCAAIDEASSQEVKEPGKYLEKMKTALTKGERDAIVNVYNTPDVELLPPGNTVWRMSNAISLFAQSIDDDDRKVDLMKIAGNVIPSFAKAA